MSTEQQQYYSNTGAAPHPQANNYFIPQNTMDPQFQSRNPGGYAARMNQPYISQPIHNGYQQYYPPPTYLPASYVAGGNPRPMGQYIQNVQILRPQNETSNPQNYMSPPFVYGQSSQGLPPGAAVYAPQFYPSTYSMGPNYPTIPQQTIPNQAIPQQQQPFQMSPGPQQPPQPMYQPQPTPHQQMEQINVPTSQPSIPQNIQQSNTYQQPQQQQPPQQPVVTEKRQRKPLVIVDPHSHKAVDLSGSSTAASTATTNPPPPSSSTTTTETRPTETTTDSTATTNRKQSTSDATKVQEFRQQFARLLADNPNTSTDKASTSNNNNPPSIPTGPNDDATSTIQQSQKESESIVQPPPPPQSTSSASSSRSGSMSRPKSPSSSIEQSQPSVPGIRTRSFTDDKRERSDSQKQSEIESTPTSTTNDQSKSTSDNTPVQKSEEEQETFSNAAETRSRSPLTSTTSSECVTPPQTPTPATKNEKISIPAPNQRLRYDRQELLRIRDSSSSLPPPDLPKNLDIVVNNNANAPNARRDHQRLSYPQYTGANSQGRGNSYHRQSSQTSHSSVGRYQNNQSNSTHDSKRKQAIYLTNEPDFQHRVENPYKPTDQTKLDANNKVIRDCKAILNKVTPQTYDKLLKQLEALEIDRYERLEGMINIFFSKAVDEPAFSFLYAKLCKQFQKKQVTVPSEDGKTVTYYFRQILLTRCQKEFENDYRQEIEYEKRKIEVEAITDEKKQKEEGEKLEEDLVKAKRRKLGNIFFIGELFKLQMLTDTIMYDCIEYLLRDKTDEEALECLCRLLRTIGKELDIKASEKLANKQNLEKHYRELTNIVREFKTSARIRFMIQDLAELRQANWVARRAEAKPTTIDEIHEQERLKREQQEREQERERQQRRDQNRSTVIGSAYSGGNQQQFSGSRGSGIKQQASRNDEDRVENRFNVNSVRQLQSNDKRGQGPLAMNLAPQRTWSKGSGIEKKPEEDRSFVNRASKPPTGQAQLLKGKPGSAQGGSGYPLQRQSSRELARENSQRDRENALQSLRKTTGGSGINSPVNTAGTSSMTNSREGSRNVSREQSRNASRESSVSERASNVSLSTQLSKTSSINESPTVINQDPSNTTFDEEKTQARVHSLIEEYTENYSDNSDRPVKEALEDLAAFRTPSSDQQSLIVRELFTNVLEAKPRARKAVGHLLDAAINDELISQDAFLSGFKRIVEDAPDYAVDIPLIWQYIGEIIGALIGAPSLNISLLKPILQCVPDDKTKQLFQYVIRYATEFSSQSRIQKFWQASGLSLSDLIKSDLIDSSFANEYDWLSETPMESEPTTPQTKENLTPRADPQLVKLFKSVNDPGTAVSDPEIIGYIKEHMNPNDKFYIRNIVLSYLEACLINRDPQKKIQEDIAKKRMTVLNAIIEHKPEAEIQAVYAIQNFVNKLEHPPKMARLLFDIFYDEECVSEDAFFEWLRHPDQSETEGHAVVEMSTKDFFTWLQQAETEVEEGEEEEGS